jgi:hypothetical protein
MAIACPLFQTSLNLDIKAHCTSSQVFFGRVISNLAEQSATFPFNEFGKIAIYD